MIDISANPIQLTLPRGGVLPFDPDGLRRAVAGVLSPNWNHPEIPRDIVLAVEFAIRKLQPNLPAGTPCSVPESAVSALVSNILDNIGCRDAADLFRARHVTGNDVFTRSTRELREFLEQNLVFSDSASADGAVQWVSEALKKLSAPDAPPPMILELARYYLEHSAALPHELIPRRNAETCAYAAQFLDFSEYAQKLCPEAHALTEDGTLKVHRTDLRIFPTLRVEVRLLTRVRAAGLTGPLTDLNLAPLCFPLTDAIDAICVCADAQCTEKGFGAQIPLKLLIHFADAREFAEQYLVSSPEDSPETQMRDLAALFRSLLARKPYKFTCPAMGTTSD